MLGSYCGVDSLTDFSSGWPIASASDIEMCSYRISSTSLEETFSPPPAQNHVIQPIDHNLFPLVVPARHISSVRSAFQDMSSLVKHSPVPLHNIVSLNNDFAYFSISHLLILIINDLGSDSVYDSGPVFSSMLGVSTMSLSLVARQTRGEAPVRAKSF